MHKTVSKKERERERIQNRLHVQFKATEHKHQYSLCALSHAVTRMLQRTWVKYYSVIFLIISQKMGEKKQHTHMHTWKWGFQKKIPTSTYGNSTYIEKYTCMLRDFQTEVIGWPEWDTHSHEIFHSWTVTYIQRMTVKGCCCSFESGTSTFWGR